jgi:hypothetical protein
MDRASLIEVDVVEQQVEVRVNRAIDTKLFPYEPIADDFARGGVQLEDAEPLRRQGLPNARFA